MREKVQLYTIQHYFVELITQKRLEQMKFSGPVWWSRRIPISMNSKPLRYSEDLSGLHLQTLFMTRPLDQIPC